MEDAIAGAKWRLAYQADREAVMTASLMSATGNYGKEGVDPRRMLGRPFVDVDERPEFQPRPPTEEDRDLAEQAERTSAFLAEHAERMRSRDRG